MMRAVVQPPGGEALRRLLLALCVIVAAVGGCTRVEPPPAEAAPAPVPEVSPIDPSSVSYTHLTLPTN